MPLCHRVAKLAAGACRHTNMRVWGMGYRSWAVGYEDQIGDVRCHPVSATVWPPRREASS